MLKKWQTYWGFHLLAAQLSIKSFGKKPLSTLLILTMIGLTLTLPTLFWVAMYNVSQLSKQWQSNGHISLYLKPKLTVEEQQTLLTNIKAVKGVAEARLKTPDEGLADIQAQEGLQDILNDLPENPLPAVIEVIPEMFLNTPEALQQFVNQLQLYPQIDIAQIDMQWINRLLALARFIQTIAYGFILLLACAVVVIIGNTLKLAVQNRHEEIQVLKLIGATDSFIARPFLYSGVWYGGIGALLAIFVVNLFIFMTQLALTPLISLYQIHFRMMLLTFPQGLILLTTAIILGWIGAFVSVKKQLASIEP